MSTERKLARSVSLIDANGRIAESDQWEALCADLEEMVQAGYAAKAASHMSPSHWGPGFRARMEALIEQAVALHREAFEMWQVREKEMRWEARRARIGVVE